MERMVGTTVRGLRAPIVKEGDDIVKVTVDTLIKASEVEGYKIRDKDVVALTESIVARAQGNFAHIDAIAKDINEKFGDKTIGLIFPILSRNRFGTILSGIAKGAKKIVLMLSYPADEVGNHLVDIDRLDKNNINPWKDVLTETQFRKFFQDTTHQFTGMDYIEYYKGLVEEQDVDLEIIFSNDPKTILVYTKNVIACDIHSRKRTKSILRENGADLVYGLDDILTESIDGNGYNEEYGLLGSNKATDNTLKLFPRDCQSVVDKIQEKVKEKTGKTIEVMVYGDGAFKDPVGQIWELADPVVSPGYTSGLEGRPSEIKLKYLADNDFADLEGEELEAAISTYIKNKDESPKSEDASLGTTPRRITDLLGSLCDLTSGSGDKGTPIVYVQGYFDNFTG